MSRNRRPDIEDNSCCGLRFLKIVVYFFNFLFYISGVALILLSVWTFFFRWHYVSLLPGNSFKLTAHLSLLIGFLVIAVATFGCAALSKEKLYLLLFHTLMSLTLLLLEGMLCVYSYAYYEQVELQLSSSVATTLIRDHSVDIDVTRAFTVLHNMGRCCGAFTFEDWRNSVWWQNENTAALAGNRGFDLAVPEFCCRSPSTNCGRRDHPSNIYYNGCLRYLTEYIKDHLMIISAVSFAVVIIQLIGTSFATLLFVKLRDFSSLQQCKKRIHGEF